MNPLAVFLLIGGDWILPEIAGVLTLAAVIGVAFARIAFAAAGTGLPF